ncbi:glutamine--tRNA ligase [endosymbiont 'TC1' of Trimyema compressum]|uniref:glutamine--tRNA ligase/YqeY domain fusion protein n=1 Tax=endosymbiont 'TC1' of Trimyema compressum TaxID=243899 RepID=UPI0007F15937|nr:glutamine--tRNA ligase/YqeY domain fusion protein [endosymbiont 'TC1' of Trimyema compressum]AMP20637.1 glutamine--tRNA ligase [endosymbiont 'TC1' of Trimyema compressum]
MESFENVSFGFLDNIIEDDLAKGDIKKIHTRFPPEPNGFLHIGHAKAISVNFGIAKKYDGICNLRFDDTNPSKEEEHYIEAIKEDIEWLGFDWENRLFYASEYFDQMYNYACKLIKMGKAYVCQLSAEEIRENRGTLTEKGINSPYRNRSVEENSMLFEAMKKGEIPEGEMVLRAKINMGSPNLNMRDPVIYRVMKAHHHNAGNDWCIYPMYDFAHPIEDALEGITHSFCSLEFEDHRPLYEWVLEEFETPYLPKQREFARLNINYTVMSKRKLRYLVEHNIVSGWDDPRMPTIQGLRKRGYTPKSIRKFVLEAGIAKNNSIIDMNQLEATIREDLNYEAKRAMAVLDPLKVIINNFNETETLWLEGDINPEQKELGKRKIPFTKELYVEKDDFFIEPPKGFRRLYPGNEVRLKDAFYVMCNSYDLDENGNVIAIHCTYDPKSKGGWSDDGRKVKGTIHWVSVPHAVKGTAMLYNRLFNVELPEDGAYEAAINENSLIERTVYLEPYLLESQPEEHFQFLRKGYFVRDRNSDENELIFNRIVSLKESFKVKK